MPTIAAGTSLSIGLQAGERLVFLSGAGTAQIVPPEPASVSPTTFTVTNGAAFGPASGPVGVFVVAQQLVDYEVQRATDVLSRSGSIATSAADLAALTAQGLTAGRTAQTAVFTPRASSLRSFPQSLGTLVTDWQTGATGTAATNAVWPEARWPVPSIPQTNGAAATYFAQAVTGTESSDFTNMGVWLRANRRVDGQSMTYGRIDFGTDSTFANRALAALTIPADGVWRFYVLPRAQWGTSGTFTVGTTTFSHVRVAEQGSATSLTFASGPTAGATSATLSGAFGATTEAYPVRFSTGEVRIVQLTNGATSATWATPLTSTATTSAVYSATRLAAQTNDLIQAGPMYRNARGRAAFMVRLDDGVRDHMIARLSLATPYVGTSGVTIPANVPQSALSILQAFGLRASSFISTRQVDLVAQNFLTWEELRTLQNVHGWQICFQTHANPFSSNNLGLRLLGPFGFNYAANVYGSITGVSANVVTTASVHRIARTSGQAGIGGFPVELIGPTLPSTALSIGQQVWLREGTTTTFTMHPTELDAENNTNVIALTNGATSWGFRYWGSSAGTDRILADFTTGQGLMQANGLNGWRNYAANQGAFDLSTETAILALRAAGNLRLCQGTIGDAGVGSSSYLMRPNFTAGSAGVGFVGGGQLGCTLGNWLNAGPALSTEAVTETNIRIAVRSAVERGGIISNYHHFFANETSMRQFIAYCDECKLMQDLGLAQQVQADEFASILEDNGVL